MTTFNCFFSIFISPLRFSFCAWNMKDDKGMEFWLSRFSPQPAPAQLSSLTPLLPSLLFPQLSRLLLQIDLTVAQSKILVLPQSFTGPRDSFQRQYRFSSLSVLSMTNLIA